MKSLSHTALSVAVLFGFFGAPMLASSPPSLNVAPSNSKNTDVKPFWRTLPPYLITPLLRLKIISEIGSGSFGSVGTAEDSWPVKLADGVIHQEKGTVAVKCVTRSLWHKKGSGRRYLESVTQEFVIHRAAAEVSTSILPVYYIFVDKQSEPDMKCFTMKYAPAGDLNQMIIKARRGMPESLAKTIVFHIAHAIKKLGEHGIFHRDIKPDNIVLLSDYSPKLIDFGLATFLDERSPTTRQLMSSYERLYQAPEVLNHTLPMDRDAFERAEVYSLGKTLQVLVTGRRTIFQVEHDDDALTNAYDLIEWMTHSKSSKRCTISQLLNHKWLASVNEHTKGGNASPLEVLAKVVAADGASMNEVKQWLCDAKVYDKMST